MKKVILIGGSPMVGKSTVALSLANKIKYPCLSTDDIGEALQTISDINPMRGQNYLDYYVNNDITKLIDDIKEYHNKIEPAILKLIDIHSTWGNPVLMEGWALYPKQIKKTCGENVFAVWLIADDELLRNRIVSNNKFYQYASEPEKFIENYLFRSKWHNNEIYTQCKSENQRYVNVNNTTSINTIVNKIINLMNE